MKSNAQHEQQLRGFGLTNDEQPVQRNPSTAVPAVPKERSSKGSITAMICFMSRSETLDSKRLFNLIASQNNLIAGAHQHSPYER